MKKVALALSTLSYLSFTQFAFADTLCPSNATFNGLCNLTPGKTVGQFINLIFVIAVIVALLYLIWGGFRWLTSSGDKTGVQNAREHIVAAIVGLVIIFISYFLLNILIQFFIPGFNFSDFQIPNVSGK